MILQVLSLPSNLTPRNEANKALWQTWDWGSKKAPEKKTEKKMAWHQRILNLNKKTDSEDSSTFKSGCQMVPFNGFQFTIPSGFKWHPDLKVQVEARWWQLIFFQICSPPEPLGK